MKLAFAISAVLGVLGIVFFGFLISGHEAHGGSSPCPIGAANVFECAGKITAAQMAVGHIGNLSAITNVTVATIILAVLLIVILKSQPGFVEARLKHKKFSARERKELISVVAAATLPFRRWTIRMINSPGNI